MYYLNTNVQHVLYVSDSLMNWGSRRISSCCTLMINGDLQEWSRKQMYFI